MPNTIIDKSGFSRNVDDKASRQYEVTSKTNIVSKYVDSLKFAVKRPNSLYSYGSQHPADQKLAQYAPFDTSRKYQKNISMMPPSYGSYLPNSGKSIISSYANTEPLTKVATSSMHTGAPLNFKNEAY